MPITPRDYERRPYVRPAYEPDTRTVMELMRAAGQSRANAIGRRGQARAEGLMTIGQMIGQALQSQRVGRERQQLAEMELAEKRANREQDEAYRRDQLAALTEEREAARQIREDQQRRLDQADAYKRGGEIAEDVKYGPLQESQVDPLMAGPAANRVRYAFGPGTADGPELQPNREQQDAINARQAVERMGGTIGPNGQVVMPPQAPREPNPTEASLAMMAARGDKAAAQALATLQRLRAPQTPQTSQTTPVPSPVNAPTDPNSQDIMGHAGLSRNGFLALTNPTMLPRDQRTRNAASAEVAQWAATKGIDTATFSAQFKAMNEVLQSNIERFNTVKNIEGELAGSVANLSKAAVSAGLNDVQAVNAAKLWLNGQLNDPAAADYAFSLRALVSDIARYNAASSGRAPLESDMSDARAIVQSGIASGSLNGMQRAVNRSVENMSGVMESAVDRAARGVWNLFGVGDKYKPVTRPPRQPAANNDPLGIRK